MSSKALSCENHRVVIIPRRLGDFGMARIYESSFYKDEHDRHQRICYLQTRHALARIWV